MSFLFHFYDGTKGIQPRVLQVHVCWTLSVYFQLVLLQKIRIKYSCNKKWQRCLEKYCNEFKINQNYSLALSSFGYINYILAEVYFEFHLPGECIYWKTKGPKGTCCQVILRFVAFWEHQNFPCLKLVILWVYITISFGSNLVGII